MKLKNCILAIISFASICYGIYAFYAMVFNCKAPLYIECVGVKADTNKVYAISNNKSYSADTICLNYPQSKAIMPSALGFIFFNKATNTFCLKNNTCIYNPTTANPSNYFLPFAHTLNDKWYDKIIDGYFSANEIVPENVLIQKGIKYNSAVGTKENRVSVIFIKHNSNIYLKIKDDGIAVKYLIRKDTVNSFDVILNQPIVTNNKFIYNFDNTTKDTGHYIIDITPSAFSFAGSIKNENGTTIANIKSGTNTFEAGDYLFQISFKYSKKFSILYSLFLLALTGFQFYFFFSMLRYKSEVYESLYSLRILINALVFLGVPIFLTSYYLGVNRSLYLGLVMLLNLSYFTPKNLFHKIKFNNSFKYSNTALVLIAVALTVILWKFTKDEQFFGVPILHIQKLVLLLVIFITQIHFFDKYKFGKWYRLSFILGFSILVSFLTSDLGSCIYTSLAMLLIELIKKTIKPKLVLFFVVGLVAVLYLIFQISPGTLTGSKSYRIVAPHTLPSNDALIEAKQADRETYAGINYILKNRLNSSLPAFNSLHVPASFRSTMHTDFSFLWSFAFGGYTFILLFALVIISLCRELLLLLYLCTRVIRINKENYFLLPASREGELIRFYIAFTLVQFVYPVCFSLLLLPLTGQSLCALAVSNWEIVFLGVLLVVLHSVFTNKTYFTKTAKIQYAFADAKKSIRYVLLVFTFIFCVGFGLKFYSIRNMSATMQWQKHTKSEDIELKKQIPSAENKEQLVAFAKEIIGTDDLTAVATKKKLILKELASLYYTNKPYNQNVYDSKNFNIAASKMLLQMNIDSIFIMNRKQISGNNAPFGLVYSNSQIVNNKSFNSVTNRYYSSIPADEETINADLTAECVRALEKHLKSIGISTNSGAIMIVEHMTGNVIANSYYPMEAEINANQVHYLIGSLKKLLIAYASLELLPNAKFQVFNGKTFKEFIQTSDDIYSANLLKSLLLLERTKFEKLLLNDFGLPLHVITDDSYLDTMPTDKDFQKPLDKNNTIYRQSIGMQAPYTLETVLQWYSRVASGLKTNFKYTSEIVEFEKLSMEDIDLKYLKECFNSVLYGTASIVRQPLIDNGIAIDNLFCKTGTAERADKTGNYSSSFIICNNRYSIAVMLKGDIPHNKENFSAKDLFVSLIPILKKYEIFK